MFENSRASHSTNVHPNMVALVLVHQSLGRTRVILRRQQYPLCRLPAIPAACFTSKSGLWSMGWCQVDPTFSNPCPIVLQPQGGSCYWCPEHIQPKGLAQNGRRCSRRAFSCHGWVGSRQEAPPYPIPSIYTLTRPECLKHMWKCKQTLVPERERDPRVRKRHGRKDKEKPPNIW